MLGVAVPWTLALQTFLSFFLAPNDTLGFVPSKSQPWKVRERRPFEVHTVSRATSDDANGNNEQNYPAPGEQLLPAGTINPALAAQLLPRDRYLRVWPVALGTFGGAECVVLATVPGVGLVNGKDVLAVPLEPNTWALPSWLPLPPTSSASFVASDDLSSSSSRNTGGTGGGSIDGSRNSDSGSSGSSGSSRSSPSQSIVGGMSSSAARMMDRAVRGVPLPRSEFLRLSPALVNRDGGLYDNLPWEDWHTGDSQMAKRNAYNRFLGKDYPKSSYSSPVNANAAARYFDEDASAASSGSASLPAAWSVDKAQRALDVCKEEVRDLEALLITTQKKDSKKVAESKTNSTDDGSSSTISSRLEEAIARRDLAEVQLKEASKAAGFDSNGGLLAGLLAKINGQISASPSSPSSTSGDRTQKTAGKSFSSPFSQPSSEDETTSSTASEPWSWKSFRTGLKSNDDNGGSSQDRVFGSASTEGDGVYGASGAAGFTGYSSPYALMHELVDTQLRAKVTSVVLEDAWPLPVSLDGTSTGGSGAGGTTGWPQGTPRKLCGLDDGGGGGSTTSQGLDEDMQEAARASRQLGGAVQLERKPKTIKLAGFRVPDPLSGGGATAVVECFADEAIGLAIASNAPLWVDKSLWEALKRPASVAATKITPSGGVRLEIESKTTTKQTTSSTAKSDSILSSSSPPAAPSAAPQPAWELKSASAFQAMSPIDKARTLLATNEFTRLRRRLPRPRTVEMKGAEDSLDPLLLPLMDEAVRREVLVDRSLAKGDLDQAAALLEEASSRSDVLKLLQTTEDALSEAREAAAAAAAAATSTRAATASAADTKETAPQDETAAAAAAAAAAGPQSESSSSFGTSTGTAEMIRQLEARRDFLKSELGLLTDLRADFTQDQGEYSAYLDKDEWYERDRRRALGLDKKEDQ